MGAKTESFGHLLTTTTTSNFSATTSSSSSSNSSQDFYDPYFLDDPELRVGRHCTVIALSGYYSSLSHYVPPEQLKEELNRQFHQRHSHHIHSSMTLTKIRSLKQQLIQVAVECDIELASVALAFVYLEKLIMTRAVTRWNRKEVASCCLLLAVKVHDRKEVEYGQLISRLSQQFGVSSALVLKREFPVFAKLRFDLQVPQSEYVPHLERILVDLPFSNLCEYLGERMYNLWRNK